MRRCLVRACWRRRWRGALLLGVKVGLALALALAWLLVAANLLASSLHDRHALPQPAQFRGRDSFVTSWPRAQVRGGNPGSGGPGGPGGAGGEVKTVLLWTRLFFSADWELRSTGGFLPCRVNRCRATQDRSQLPHSHAVLFHSRNLHELRTAEFQAAARRPRPAGQVWVLHNLEPPYFVYDSLAPWDGLFNWTSSYRQDSDLVSPYGRTLPRQQPSLEETPDVWASKSRNVLFVSSNCRDHARRYRVVHELERLLPIDKYGNCNNLRCGKTARCEEVFSTYKFFLAFENGFCRDYVTEKLWRAFHRRQIPVVFGGADYRALAPPHSVIWAADFPSLQALASYVLRVSQNATLYNSYFLWRRKFYTETYMQAMDWCGLCAALHNASWHRPPQVYSRLEAWLAEDTCPRYSYIDDVLATVDLIMFYIGL